MLHLVPCRKGSSMLGNPQVGLLIQHMLLLILLLLIFSVLLVRELLLPQCSLSLRLTAQLKQTDAEEY